MSVKEVLLDGGAIESREALHTALAQALEFPAWYGGNLDALFDCLTDLSEDTVIRLSHFEQLEERLGAYAGRLLRVLEAAARENAHLTVLNEE